VGKFWETTKLIIYLNYIFFMFIYSRLRYRAGNSGGDNHLFFTLPRIIK